MSAIEIVGFTAATSVVGATRAVAVVASDTVVVAGAATVVSALATGVGPNAVAALAVAGFAEMPVRDRAFVARGPASTTGPVSFAALSSEWTGPVFVFALSPESTPDEPSVVVLGAGELSATLVGVSLCGNEFDDNEVSDAESVIDSGSSDPLTVTNDPVDVGCDGWLAVLTTRVSDGGCDPVAGDSLAPVSVDVAPAPADAGDELSACPTEDVDPSELVSAAATAWPVATAAPRAAATDPARSQVITLWSCDRRR
ncbi:hypothetical protein [Mycolicibacterium hodleri]|uniref:hypothetical protein n=1 Tax=Mycolicibacterium hodleri TaxID=49897 RepID=UPI00112C35BC|nr:hypothetical protein [Mycolicibacterium hodleri]